jgi:hypothetical protein
MTYGIAYGHFSEKINIGRLNKAGTEFVGNKEGSTDVSVGVVSCGSAG